MSPNRAILLLALGQTLVWAGLYYLFPAMLLRWENSLGWTRAQLTFAFTLAVLASALAAPLAGRIIDRGHGAAQMAATAALGGLGVALLAIVTAPWQFYAIWVFVGLMFAGCLYEPCFAIITRARGANARQAITLVTLVAGFAGTISFPAVHFLAGALGWRMAVVVLGLAVTCIVAPVLWLGASDLERGYAANQPPARRRATSRAYLKSPVFWLLGTGFALSAIVHGGTLHHLLPLLDERGASPGLAVLAASMIGPMQVAGRLAMVATQTRISAGRFAFVAFAAMGAAMLILMIAGTTPALILAFVAVFGASYGTVSILRPVIARELIGQEDFGSKSGGLALIYLAASAGSAYIGALLWRAGGYQTMLFTLLVLAACGATLYAMARRLAAADPQH